MRTITTAALAALALAGCAKNADIGTPLAGGRTATAALRTSAGASVGHATAAEVAGGVRFTADVTGLPPGTHGIHVHTVGACDAPDFTTAGPHWNPQATKHGTMNPQGPHKGDMPNLLVGADGRGTVAVTIPAATMDGVLDADGAAIVVHANADDLMTDPSGSSGARIACGVFQAG
jgi:Cu-Zn family superoxide dismutase